VNAAHQRVDSVAPLRPWSQLEFILFFKKPFEILSDCNYS
jgi:hypothetical protein